MTARFVGGVLIVIHRGSNASNRILAQSDIIIIIGGTEVSMKSYAYGLVAAIVWSLPPLIIECPAQENELEKTALAIAPEDAAFFSTSVNLTDSYNDFVESGLVTRLKAVPFVQRLRDELQRQWESESSEQIRQAKATLKNPNVRNLVDLGRDMFHEEVFIYGEDDWCEALDGFVRFQTEISQLAGKDEEAVKEYFEKLTPEDVARIKIPTTVVGFRLETDELARTQLDTLEGLIRIGLGQIEPLSPILRNLRRSDLEGGQTLALTFDSSLIPMDQIPPGEEREVTQKLVELLEGRSFSIALGVKDNILLLVVGEGESNINEVGERENNLLDNAVFKVLTESVPSNMRSVSYLSKRFRESQWNANFKDYFQRIGMQFSVAMQEADEDIADLEAWQAEIQRDAAWLDAKLAEMTPEFGAYLSWGYASEVGSEGYAYDWTENLYYQNLAQLSLLNHAGTQPLIVYAYRNREQPELQEFLEYLLAESPKHLKRFIRAVEDDAEDRQRALAIIDKAWPLAEEFYQITKEKLAPALKDGEGLIAVAADWTLSSLGPNAPPLPRSVPVLELASVCQLQDRELFLDGCADMYDLFDKVAEVIREFEPDAVPPGYTVPRPDEQALTGGTRYYYGIISDAVPVDGFDPQVVVTDDKLFMGYSSRQIDDMLEGQDFSMVVEPLWSERRVATRCYADFEGMVNAFRPWVEVGLSATGRGMNEPIADSRGPIPTGNEVLQIWDSFQTLGHLQTVSAVSEEGGLISYWQWHCR